MTAEADAPEATAETADAPDQESAEAETTSGDDA